MQKRTLARFRLPGPLGLLLVLATLCPAAHAHIGSPDVYVQAKAGPYPLFITLREPPVLPGVAEVLVRAEGPGIAEITAAPTPLTGDAAMHAPTPDRLEQTPDGTYTGHLWIMATGSWQVRLHVRGALGEADLAVPLPSTSTTVRRMPIGMGFGLGIVGLLLLFGLVGIVAAGARESALLPGASPDSLRRVRGRRAAALTAALLVAIVLLGERWWSVEAAAYGRSVYKPLILQATVHPDGAVALHLHDPGWLAQRRLDDLVPDHGHLVHLYALRWPAMDAVYHLHPTRSAAGDFLLPPPAVAAGHYRLFFDIVHSTGFPETAVTEIDLPGREDDRLTGDDAGTATLPSSAAGDPHATDFALPDGYSLRFNRPATMEARRGISLRFQLLDRNGRPAQDMARYMGMPGHAAIFKSDGTVFAHIHPEGSMAMAAYRMANPEMSMDEGIPTDSDSSPAADAAPLPNNGVSFPYGFPSPGRYRIVVQLKHSAIVETGAFDVDVL